MQRVDADPEEVVLEEAVRAVHEVRRAVLGSSANCSARLKGATSSLACHPNNRTAFRVLVAERAMMRPDPVEHGGGWSVSRAPARCRGLGTTAPRQA